MDIANGVLTNVVAYDIRYETFVIPKNVTVIGDEAFEYCRNLDSVVFHDHVTSIGKAAFKNCEHLSSMVIPKSVTSIEESTFEGCKGLVSITIPDTVISIKPNAFDGCVKLSEVHIKITSMENYERILRILPDAVKKDLETKYNSFKDQVYKLMAGRTNKEGFFNHDIPLDLKSKMVPYLAQKYGITDEVAEMVSRESRRATQNLDVNQEAPKGLSM